MSKRRWAVAPIPLTTSSVFEEQVNRENMKNANELMATIPFYKDTPSYRSAMDAPMVFQDPDTGEYVKGLLEIGEASRHSVFCSVLA